MNPETSAALIRGVALMAPLGGVILVALLRRPDEPRIAAAILATGWNLLVLTALNLLALELGWWEFRADGGVVAGIPVDLLLGWALLWGALPALIAPAVRLPLLVALLAWLDVALMPYGQPVLILGPDWLYGEAAAIALALVPGLLLAHWTRGRTRLAVRAAFQVALAGGLGVVLPLALTGAWRQPSWLLGLLAQVLAVPGVLGLAAVREFAARGGGTPLPYDAPARLVTGGPYAYVRNPMQTAMTAGYLVLAVVDVRFLAAAAISFAYGAGLAAWHEGEQLGARFGDAWHDYRRQVRPWLPRWRPVMPAATLYVDTGCGRCRQVGAWVLRRAPVELTVAPAAAHLRRITYERADGAAAEGVTAFAQALTHMHLGWAVIGWLLALPGVASFVQLVLDALGAGPRRARPDVAA